MRFKFRLKKNQTRDPTQIRNEIEWLYSTLWQKPPSLRQTKFPFKLPDTVIVRDGRVKHWFFTSKDGFLLKKNRENLEFIKVHERFIQNQSLGCPIAATTMRFDRFTKQGRRVVLSHIPTISFRTFTLFESKQDVEIMQRFVPPGGDCNSMLRCLWTPQVTYIERKTNYLPFTDLDPASPYQAVVTFEGPEHLCEGEKVISTSVHHDVANAISGLVSHLHQLGIELLSACFYFKQGAKDQLHLLYASSIKCAKVHHLSINSDFNIYFDVPEEAKFFKKSTGVGDGAHG